MWVSEGNSEPSDCKVSRRSFLKLGAFTAGAILLPFKAYGITRDLSSLERSLSLYNAQTEESLDTVYWYRGIYLPSALAEINYLLRDYRVGETKPINTNLLDLLHVVHKTSKSHHPFHVVSGYRSPATNDLLRKRGKGVAKNSLHILGKAVDIYLPDVDLSSLRRVAMKSRGGGVGYYPSAGFVHLDVGRVRYWQAEW